MDYFLASKRLGFRPWTPDDFPLAEALWSDPAIAVWLGGPFKPEAIAARFATELQRQSESGVQYWPIFLLSTHQHIGCAGLRPRAGKILELGYHLKPAFWGQGLATEAAIAVIDYGFTALGLEAVFAGHHPDNAVSRRILLKLGFVYTGHEFYPPSGIDEPVYLLHRAAWFSGPHTLPTSPSGAA